MTNRIATIVLLVEDRRQETLLRRFLQRLGHSNRNIRVDRSRTGLGAGEQYVRGQFAKQVQALRVQLSRTQAWLLVLLDADIHETGFRHRQFARALKDSDQEQLRADEPIACLVARRNVETWILCLNGEDVNEDANYRNDPRVSSQAVQDAAAGLYDWSRRNARVPLHCVASLSESLVQLQRVPPIH